MGIGFPQINMIIISLLAPVPVVLIAWVIVKRLAWVRRLPARVKPAAVLFALSLATTGMLAFLGGGGPGEANASTRPSEEADDEIGGRFEGGPRVLYLFEIENWDETTRRERAAERFMQAIRKAVDGEGIYVKLAKEHHIPLDLFQTDNPLPNIMRHYHKIVPFICVWGYVSPGPEGKLESTIMLSTADRSAKPHTLGTIVLEFDPVPAKVSEAAQATAEQIREGIVEYFGD